jgi:hypothetical protein
MITASTFSLPLADGGTQMLQLAVQIYSVRAVEGTGEYRFVEYVTVATCGAAAVNNEQQHLTIPLSDDDKSPTADELFILGRQYATVAGELKDVDFFNPPENLHGKCPSSSSSRRAERIQYNTSATSNETHTIDFFLFHFLFTSESSFGSR